MDLLRYIDVFSYSHVLVSTNKIISKYVLTYEDSIVIKKHIISYNMCFDLICLTNITSYYVPILFKLKISCSFI